MESNRHLEKTLLFPLRQNIWRRQIMNEIDLKKTPLSEIDLSKIDYEKSYVYLEGRKYKVNKI